MATLDERFWSKVDRAGTDDCWMWRGNRTIDGYGRFWMRRDDGSGPDRRAHRVSYEMLVGPIPTGLVLDHTCCNRGCINPKHLEPVTDALNSQRAGAPPFVNATKTTCVRGHEFTDANTWLRQFASGRTARVCRECKRAALKGRKRHHRRLKETTSPRRAA